MPPERKLGYRENLEAVKAQRIVNAGRLGRYTPESARAICLTAGKSDGYADQVYADLKHAEMERADKLGME